MAKRARAKTLDLFIFPQPGSAQANQYWYVTQRPWPSLLFILPGLLVFEVGTYLRRGTASGGSSQLVASYLIESLVSWIEYLVNSLQTSQDMSRFLTMAPGMLLIAILLAWHVAARHPWRFDAFVLAGMLGESLIYTVPLLVFWMVHQALLAGSPAHSIWIDSLIRSFGAGIYEELVFRLICITVLVIVLIDLARLPRGPAAVVIIALSAAIFAFLHHPPLGAEPFRLQSFVFRSVAGLYLAGLFVFRGFGIAAGCHALYNVIVVTISAINATAVYSSG
jgi:hypothetical protein